MALALWTVQGLLAAAFGAAGVMKMTVSMEQFVQSGVGPPGRLGPVHQGGDPRLMFSWSPWIYRVCFVLGTGLMLYMVRVEAELGALPLALVLWGLIGMVIPRWRKRIRKSG